LDANQTYHDARERASRCLRQIEEILAAHAKRQAETPDNWGHVGFMQIVAEGLGDLVEAMGAKGGAKR
jgi:hypothetical protein